MYVLSMNVCMYIFLSIYLCLCIQVFSNDIAHRLQSDPVLLVLLMKLTSPSGVSRHPLGTSTALIRYGLIACGSRL